MLSSLNLERLFSAAVTQHIAVIHQLDSQRKHLEEVAARRTAD